MIGILREEQIEEVLLSNILGRIGCGDGSRIYVVPVNYVYEGNSIIAHSAEGMKIQMMRKNPQVCFEVDEMKSFTNWKSVIAWGEYEEITDATEKYEAMKLFVDRTLRLKISETAVLPELASERVHPRSPGMIKPVIYRIRLTEKTGRFESDPS
jgi:nitroimidazol reductase NimA-like FMN-containing flavoprotein (pyridoxamine 5'-phosphate oxidase superfamily)